MSEPTGAIAVRNHEKFQHYKDRNPPWIKLHASTLDDYAFARLPDALKAHLMLLWLLASKHDNAIPYDLEWITRRLSLTEPLNLEALADAGFITIERRKQHASALLASRKRDDSTPQAKRSPRQRRVEKEEEKASVAPAPVVALVPDGVPPTTAPGTWVQDAVALYGKHIGLIAHGRMGKALKELVALETWPEVRRWLEGYCKYAPLQRGADKWDTSGNRDVRFCSPEKFVETYTEWRTFMDGQLPEGIVA